jgi:hypothetical protein
MPHFHSIPENITLDTSNVKVQMNLLNAALQDGFITGSYSQDVMLPFSPVNDRFFQSAKFVQTRKKIRMFEDIQFIFKGMPKLKGFLILKKITQNGYQCSFSVNGFLQSIFEINLRDIDYGADIVMGSTTDEVRAFAKATTTAAYPATPCVFMPLKNENFYGDANTNYGGMINDWSRSQQSFAKNNNDVFFNRFAMVPFFYFHFILNKIFDHIGYRVKGSFYNHPEFRKLIVYNNHALDEMREAGYFRASTVNQVFDSEFNTLAVDLLPEEDEDNRFISTPSGRYSTEEGKNYTIKATFYIDRDTSGSITVSMLQNGSNLALHTFESITASGNVFLEATAVGTAGGDLSLWITCQPAAKPFTYTAVMEVFQDETVNQFSTTITPSNHVPNITLNDFFKAITTLNVKFNFDFQQKVVEMNFCEDVFKGPAIEMGSKMLKGFEIEFPEHQGFKFDFDFKDDALISDLSLQDVEIDMVVTHRSALPPAAENKGKIALVLADNRTYTAGAKRLNQWAPTTHHHPQPEFGKGANQIKPLWAPMMMWSEDDVLYPWIRQQGTSRAFGIENEFPFRLMFYRGLQSTTLGNYPLATSFNYAGNGTRIGNISLKWSGEDGLIALFWQKWIKFIMNTEMLTQDMDLNVVDVGDANFDQKHRLHENEFLLKSLKILYNSQSLEIARAEYLKINL